MEVVIDSSNENLSAMVVIDYYDHVYWMKNKGYVDVQTLNDNNLVRNDDLVHVPMTYNDGDSPDLKTCDDDDNLFCTKKKLIVFRKKTQMFNVF